MGLTSVRAGQLATIVTALEMTVRPKPAPMPAAPFRLVPWEATSVTAYQGLYRRVGAPWLWFSRLAMSEAELIEIIHNNDVRIWAVCDRAGIELGLIELDFRVVGECEIVFFGIVPELMGKGFGRWMMAFALAAAWRPDIARVWLHTCTLDAPSALGFYTRSGFSPYARFVETFDDPRLIGLLPEDAAPHIPLLRPVI